jgi:hypothetical protein
MVSKTGIDMNKLLGMFREVQRAQNQENAKVLINQFYNNIGLIFKQDNPSENRINALQNYFKKYWLESEW